MSNQKASLYRKNKHFLQKRKDDSYVSLGFFSEIKVVFVNVETNQQLYQLSYYTTDLKLTTVLIEPKLLTGNRVESLVEYGVDITPFNKYDVLAFLVESRKRAVHRYTYKQVGWFEHEEEMVFGHNKIIGSLSETQLENPLYDLTPKGSLTQYVDFHKEYVLKNVYLQLAICIAISACLIPILNERFPDITSIVIHLLGGSGSGKSTIARFICSIAGRGDNSSGSLFSSWKTTANALTLQLSYNRGIPKVFDELSLYEGNNITSLNYQLGDGREKARSTKDSQLQEQREWRTTIVSTGEMSIFSSAFKNEGQFIRLLEISYIQWFKDAEEARVIQDFTAQNYGILLPEFVRRLMKEGTESMKEIIFEAFNHCEKALYEEISGISHAERAANKFAVIPLAGALCNKLLNLQIDVEGVTTIIATQLKNQLQNIGQRIMTELANHLVKNQSKLSMDDYSLIRTEYIGQAFTVKNEVHVRLLDGILREIIHDLGYQDFNTVLKSLEKEGYLIVGKDRRLKRQTIEKQQVKFYELRLEEAYTSEFRAISSLGEDNPVFSKPHQEFNRKVSKLTDEDFEF